MSGGEGGKWLDRRWSENATIGKPDLLAVGTQSNECNSLSHFLNINNVAESMIHAGISRDTFGGG